MNKPGMGHNELHNPHNQIPLILGILSIWALCGTSLEAQSSKAAQADSVQWKTVAEGFAFPEGPAWDPVQNRLCVSNCYSDWVALIQDGRVDTLVQQSDAPQILEKTNGLAVGPDGWVYGCEFGKGSIIRISAQGDVEVYASGFQNKSFNRPNDLAFDSGGNVYFTDPKSYDPDKPDGAVYRIDKETRQVKQVATELAFPNGIAFSPDGQFVYLCASAKQRVLRYRLINNGSLGDREVFAELPGGDPDGIAFDRKSRLYVAHFGGSAVYVLDKNGQIQRKISTPGAKPSNVEFGGQDYRTLYITEDETNAVYSTRVTTPGLRLFSSPQK